MSAQFKSGQTVYAKDGKSYVVEAVEGGTVYCSSESGTEMEFPLAGLFSAEQWAARADGRRDAIYVKLRQSRAYAATTHKLDPALATQLLAKAERLTAGLIDYVAYSVAVRVLTENHDADLAPTLSIVKARDIFETAKPEVRATLLAEVLFIDPAMLINAVKLGDNVLRVHIDKGIAAHGEDFENFCDRPRK
jgi:hypothetical protein